MAADRARDTAPEGFTVEQLMGSLRDGDLTAHGELIEVTHIGSWPKPDDHADHVAMTGHDHPPGPCPVPKPEGWNPVA